ncbi:MAG TPA: PEP/pyruvate-binding domain-containing protein [Oligoflexus sp.]|uniref:PEP/pyruvate-binding domain-containing protein n=1 Tax=Oligoflexus sp. TaxID=1971216 RepID=UPI002D28D593|nr:PEP/pyruvate-binding domain-containing protein [Oligoflexus sp.]HYX32307.1 PEP/pyruvate-binding domain-containing protein [Oligoflexus sp.]
MKYWIVKAQDSVKLQALESGGKARNLAFLSQQNFPVPPWFALGRMALQAFLEQHHFHAMIQRAEATEAFEAEVLAAFLDKPLPAEVLTALRMALQEHGFQNEFVAVRSSGLDEDGGAQSFAGQYSSFLFQKGEDQIIESIKRCWASAFSHRVLHYRLQNKLEIQNSAMGVVIQRMLHADRAGVLFTRHPIKVLDRDKILISAVFGAGEGLVSGLLAADSFELSRASGEVVQDIASKTEALEIHPNGGLQKVSLPPEMHTQPTLSASQIQKLGVLADQVERMAGSPQDIEWVLEKDELYLVQTRPITNLPPEVYYQSYEKKLQPFLWDNSNIIESYSGVTSPLTFSFASRAYNQVYIQFMDVMGVPKQHVEDMAPTFRNLLGLLRGRIYYNLANWYELVLALPGTASNKTFMETMMGVKQELGPDLQKVFDGIRAAPQYGFFDKIKLLAKTFYRFRKIDSIIAVFFKDFNRVYDEARAVDMRAMALPEQLAYYFHLENSFLKKWQAPIINDYLCMIFFGLLKKLTGQWIQGADTESLQNDLLCGEGGLDSTEPTKFLLRLAKRIDVGDPAFKAWFISTPVAEVIAGLRGTYKDTSTAKDFAEFLDRFGFRCVNELKLEEPDLHDDPSFLIHSLVSYMRMQSFQTEDMEVREREIRSKAEAIVDQNLRGWKRGVYNFVLKEARRAVKNRENLRFARTKSFGLTRHLFRAMGAQLVAAGLLQDERDIFYLSIDEIIAFVEGRGLTTRLGEIVAIRKAEFDDYRRTPSPPERFISYGAVGFSLVWPSVLLEADLLRSLQEVGDDPDKMHGTPCCPGVVEGTVRVVETLADAAGINGDILVTSRTDPGWVPLFPSCSGLLIERGSLLSHSAVVARELGLPTIVGVNGGLMKRLKTGDRVRLDAGKGEITILR